MMVNKTHGEYFDEDEWICFCCWLFEENGEIASCCCSSVDYGVLMWTVWLTIRDLSEFREFWTLHVTSVMIPYLRKTERRYLFSSNWLMTSVRIAESVWFESHEEISFSLFYDISSRNSIRSWIIASDSTLQKCWTQKSVKIYLIIKSVKKF